MSGFTNYRNVIRRDGNLYIKGKNGYFNLDKTNKLIKSIKDKNEELTGETLQEIAKKVLEDKLAANMEQETAGELVSENSQRIFDLYDPKKQETIDPLDTLIDEYNTCFESMMRVGQPPEQLINFCNGIAEKWTKELGPMTLQEEHDGGRKLRNKKNKKTRKNHKRATKRKQVKKMRTRSK